MRLLLKLDRKNNEREREREREKDREKDREKRERERERGGGYQMRNFMFQTLSCSSMKDIGFYTFGLVNFCMGSLRSGR